MEDIDNIERKTTNKYSFAMHIPDELVEDIGRERCEEYARSSFQINLNTNNLHRIEDVRIMWAEFPRRIDPPPETWQERLRRKTQLKKAWRKRPRPYIVWDVMGYTRLRETEEEVKARKTEDDL